MGEQGGLRTGWLAAFGTEGYEGEPPLLEELGVNFGHIKIKVYVLHEFFRGVDTKGRKKKTLERLLLHNSTSYTLLPGIYPSSQPPNFPVVT